ncbi:bifunctional diaminohydroxyphosphoribosylaminopyrimidine deaminase/5-amino-6-(5-phosphoribosylamino)uracil reductase RibD [Tissierella pigra]|uniref:Riboflavin biosynthesis protein RibD n=1 Tax=Tissierella pigra TaxID=2607614 RepID=A0A6N7Y0G9_9FIRM|nr:bifunctional diaminohydroxyphosphoribosylaminopyrimidine deaminase/5-amino-6-(5-phosphoribosylamino)uracil reductase RibD [Tissierella pigra]MBU5426844.1 bifunctional diaminohydroxyphosphoribosylaminopyrimidine deaminase/5-amino-6-(5-phosphoribosylamino)uracil reductase RibD [Tissierella pigra]MSU03243.1 bifunctional diaminohydroxyphosphoribosylaminopyrimidine deaminase/5-amino-6-(5-phosphoribosylamino)uracil reductase RibD [Tissierella pigra]
MNIDYMSRALELAKEGIGYTNPNPLVGAVIVKDNRIIGEGYHKVYGSHHAEINAFLNANEDVKDATMYINLEPCSHHGKTPPCTKTIIEKGIKKVIIGLKDPNPIVSGRGVQTLEEAGIEVVIGILEEEGKKLNEIFIKYITTKFPFVIMKTAMTLDGKIATYTNESKWITGELSRKYVHELRHRVTGIMVGIGTVLADDPSLTTRLEDSKCCDPIRIIVDSSAQIPLEAKVLNLESDAGTIIAVTEKANKEKIKMLEKKGAEVIVTPSKEGRVDLSLLMKKLGKRNIDSILLEGGSELNYAALEEGIVDKVNVFIAPKIIGGNTAKTPIGGQGKAYIREAIELERLDFHRFGEDIMVEAYIRKKGG